MQPYGAVAAALGARGSVLMVKLNIVGWLRVSMDFDLLVRQLLLAVISFTQFLRTCFEPRACDHDAPPLGPLCAILGTWLLCWCQLYHGLGVWCMQWVVCRLGVRGPAALRLFYDAGNRFSYDAVSRTFNLCHGVS